MREVIYRIPTPPDGYPRKVTEAHVSSSNQSPNIYRLDDGTILALETIPTRIWRMVDLCDNDGNPIYFAETRTVTYIIERSGSKSGELNRQTTEETPGEVASADTEKRDGGE